MPPTLPTPDTYRMPSALGYLLHRNAKSVRMLAERAFAHDSALTFPQLFTLVALRDGIVGTPGQIARELNLNSGAVTRMLDQIERMTLVRRERSLFDRRSIRLTLTAKGRCMIERLLPRLLDLWSELLADFTDEDYRILLALQLRLQTGIERFEADPDSGPAQAGVDHAVWPRAVAGG